MLLEEVFNNISSYNSLSYELRIQERMNGEIRDQISKTKLIHKPFKVYIHQLHPQRGMEILYAEGVNDGKAIINPNGFPWINLHLDPNGAMMRESTHHTIFESGFKYFGNILEKIISKYKDDIDKLITNSGTIDYSGISCIKLILNNSEFAIKNYTVKEGETILSIAREKSLSEHMIVELNDNLADYSTAISKGDIVKLPSAYAKKMVMYIDKKRKIPIMIRVFDDKGLYEQYDYTKVVLNPQFNLAEFSKNYKEYGF